MNDCIVCTLLIGIVGMTFISALHGVGYAWENGAHVGST